MCIGLQNGRKGWVIGLRTAGLFLGCNRSNTPGQVSGAVLGPGWRQGWGGGQGGGHWGTGRQALASMRTQTPSSSFNGSLSFGISALKSARKLLLRCVFPLKENVTGDDAGAPKGCLSANILQFYSWALTYVHVLQGGALRIWLESMKSSVWPRMH